MPRMSLPDGSPVLLNALEMSSTYAGWLEGAPTVELNTRIVDAARKKGASMHGARATFVLPPRQGLAPDRMRATASDDVRGRTRQPRATLPKWVVFAWLDSNPILDKAADGSELVLVWFTDTVEGKSVGRLVHDAVAQVPWASVARDYSF